MTDSAKLTVKPMDGYILVQPLPPQKDSTGLELPTVMQKNKNKGTVVAVCDSPGVSSHQIIGVLPVKVQVGDVVYLKNYIDQPIEMGEGKYFFVEYEDILGVEVS